MLRPTRETKQLVSRGVSTIHTDPVNHPSHYKSSTGLESIDVIESFQLGFCLGNAVKYILRAGKKDKEKTIEDLRKAVWYIQRFINTYSTPE